MARSKAFTDPTTSDGASKVDSTTKHKITGETVPFSAWAFPATSEGNGRALEWLTAQGGTLCATLVNAKLSAGPRTSASSGETDFQRACSEVQDEITAALKRGDTKAMSLAVKRLQELTAE